MFKGGTALRLIHQLDRYSEDLDFNHPDKREKIINTAETCADNIYNYGIPAEIRELRWGTTGVSFSLSYQGPLFQERTLSSKPDELVSEGIWKGVRLSSKGKIRIDVSTREEDYESELSLIKVDYPDINDFWVRSLTIEELAAEKIRALLTRGKPRDLFDVWYLYEHGVVPDKNTIDKKLSIYEEHMELEDTLMEIEDDWESDLSVLLRQTPPFEKVTSDLNEFLQDLPSHPRTTF